MKTKITNTSTVDVFVSIEGVAGSLTIYQYFPLELPFTNRTLTLTQGNALNWIATIHPSMMYNNDVFVGNGTVMVNQQRDTFGKWYHFCTLPAVMNLEIVVFGILAWRILRKAVR